MKGYSVVICDDEYLNDNVGNGIRLDNVRVLELDTLITMVTKNKGLRLIIIESYEIDD